ncbi:MAG: hypothetical protein QM778_16255 [Myxococcales bacterium]
MPLRSPRLFLLLWLLGFGCAVPAARAQAVPPPAPAAGPALPDHDFGVRGNVGLMHQSNGFVFLIEPVAAYRYKFLTGGVGGRLGFYHHISTSLGAFLQGGFVLPFERGRIELLGLAGFNSYANIEREMGLGRRDPGLDITLPFAGARLGAGRLFGRGRVRALLGGSVAFERDLRQGSRAYEYIYQPDGWIGEPDDPQQLTARHHFGWTRFGVFVNAGIVIEPRRHASSGRPARRP